MKAAIVGLTQVRGHNVFSDLGDLKSPHFAENSHVRFSGTWGVDMTDVTRILNSIERGARRVRMNSCRWSMRNYGWLQPGSSPASNLVRYCKRWHRLMRPMAGTYDLVQSILNEIRDIFHCRRVGQGGSRHQTVHKLLHFPRHAHGA